MVSTYLVHNSVLSRSHQKRFVVSRYVHGATCQARRLGQWAVLALFLHLIWEIAHVRLYTTWRDESPSYIAYSVLHCTVGDVLIAVGTYLLSALATRRVDWPVTALWPGAVIAMASGVGYTAYSEWVNVYRLHSWQYLPSMPLVGGIGVTPLMQWIVIPLLMIVLWRRYFHSMDVIRRRNPHGPN